MKLSLITITYNSEKTLEDTISSIRMQHEADLEYIIVDGGSTDNTIKIIEKNKDIITRWISEPDQGISDAFNKGLHIATGDIIGIINSDDKLTEGALKIVKDNFDSNTDVLFGNVICFGNNITPFIGKSKPNTKLLYDSMSIMHPAVYIRKKVYELYGGFDIELKCVMDRELLLRFLINGANFKYIDSNLAWFRVGGASRRFVFKNTIPENEYISIMYGKNKVKAKLFSVKSIINLFGSELLERHKWAEYLIRKILHKQRSIYHNI